MNGSLYLLTHVDELQGHQSSDAPILVEWVGGTVRGANIGSGVRRLKPHPGRYSYSPLVKTSAKHLVPRKKEHRLLQNATTLSVHFTDCVFKVSLVVVLGILKHMKCIFMGPFFYYPFSTRTASVPQKVVLCL